MLYVFILAIIIGSVLRAIRNGVRLPWKLTESIRAVISNLLEGNEEIKAVGEFSTSDPNSWFSVGGTALGIPFLGMRSYWYVAITNQKVIFVKLGGDLDDPDYDKIYRVPLTDVQQEPKGISVKTTDPRLPERFYFFFGPKIVTGLDRKEFVRALAPAPK